MPVMKFIASAAFVIGMAVALFPEDAAQQKTGGIIALAGLLTFISLRIVDHYWPSKED